MFAVSQGVHPPFSFGIVFLGHTQIPSFGTLGVGQLQCATSIVEYVPSLAGTATTVSYAAKTSHRFYAPDELAALGITFGQLRFSIGLEDAEDIISEINDALKCI